MMAVRWQVLAPFAHTSEPGWIVADARRPGHDIAVVPAGYRHDRSRPVTGARAWLDYFGHALRAWRAAAGTGGFVTWFPQLAVCVGLIKRLNGSRQPLIAWCFNLGDIHGGWRGSLARFALRDVDIFVVHARREIPAYAAWLGLPPERFVFAPLAVATPEDSVAVNEEPFVLAMGSARRDYALFITVMRKLGLPAVIVCGPHALEGLDIPGNVEVLSGLPIEACHDLARRARVNVTPIANDATASGQVTVIEAMMLGKAVAATRCIGTEDYVEDGITGLLVPPGDEAALRCAIERLWHDDELRRRLGRAAQGAAMRQFSFAAGTPTLAALVQAAGPNGHHPPPP
jgi:glycosyltransferase involved in cell wall biosynthesis